MPSADLPDLDLDSFRQRLGEAAPDPLPPQAVEALFAHYRELRRWNRTLSLIGPGTVEEIFRRHYGESLAALPWVPADCRELVDVGSGAGFPGFVLAAALPQVHVTLVEARQRKWAFLCAAARRAALPCLCLNARVDVSLPAGLPQQFDLVTVRALKLPPEHLQALARCLTPGGRMLLWVGEATPRLPTALRLGDEHRLPGSTRRRILELCRAS